MGRGDPSPFNKSSAAGLVGLVYLARAAFEERRRKQCLEITAAILKIEPEHEEARTMRAAVRADLERDFTNARALAKEAQAKSDRELYGRATATLRRIVDADSENLEAQSLLNETVAAGFFTSESRTAPPQRASLPSILMGCLVVVLLVVSFVLLSRFSPIASVQLPVSAASAATAESATAASSTGQPELPNPDPVAQISLNANAVATAAIRTTPVPAIELRSDNRIVPLKQPNSTPGVRGAAVPPAPAPAPPVIPAIPASVIGFLAVSAAVPVDIYRGDEFLGSTPTTLQLPAGPQTLEYRYQGFRQTLTHTIPGRETTIATVSFPIRVQINARPWAQVFVDGTRLTPLGQTPLGDVAVPIGSILVFQNPGYPDKRYRVTARDAAIQMTFP